MKRNSVRILKGVSSFVPILSVLISSTCIGQITNQVLIWGNNSYGQFNVPASATNVIGLAAGDYHCLALKADGTVVAWGQNFSGQTNVPPDLTNVVSIAAGSTHSLALRNDGTISLWGLILLGGTIVPPEATNVVALALGPGAQHAVVLRADGTVVDWDNQGKIRTNIPSTARNVVSVSSGAHHTVALRSDGRVVAWGDNSVGQINVPASATNVVAVASGWYGNAAIRADGTVLVWGGSNVTPPGFLGFTNLVDVACPFNSYTSTSILAVKRNGTLTEWSASLPQYPTNQIAAVAAGSYDGLALVGSGPPVFPGMPVNRTVASGMGAYFRMNAVGALPIFYQWSCNGTNIAGETNLFLTLTSVQPALAGNSYTVTASNALGTTTSGPMLLSEVTSELHISATSSSAVVQATVTFTANTIGQGPFSYQWQFNGTNLDATSSILTLTNLQLADAGVYTVVVSNSFGVVTDSVSLSVTPTIITNLPQSQTIFPGGTVSFSIGLQHVIPVTYQWQLNGVDLEGATNNSITVTNAQRNQAGLYSVIFSDAFEAVTNYAALSVVPVAAWGAHGQSDVPAGLTNLIAISSGDSHSLALKADRTIIGWGAIGATPPPGLTNIISIAAGHGDSLALCEDGTVVAWGYNAYGETNVPVGLTGIVAIAAGDYHNIALKSDGSVTAWGANSYGQTNVPVDLTNVVAIAAGKWNSMALRADGTVVAWGAGTNNSGIGANYGQSIVPPNLSNVVQIATGGPDDMALKADGSIVAWGANFYGENVPPPGLSNVVAIAGGYAHSAALRADGTVIAWGYNSFGETNVPAGLSNVVAIGAKGYNTLALVADGPPDLQVTISNVGWTANSFHLSVPSRSGRVYALEYKNSLADTTWIRLPLAAGNGSTLTLTDPAATNSQRFYRIRQW